MKMNYLREIGLSVFLITCCSTVFSQANNSINGFIFGLERQPVSQITVELLDEYQRTISRTQTDGSGRYTFSRLGQGRFFVHIVSTATGYEEQTKEIEIVTITRQASSSESFQLNFSLKPVRNGAGVTPGSVVFAQEIPEEAKKAFLKGIEYLEKKNQAEGISQLEKSIEIFPKYYLAYERLSEEYVKQKKYFEAYNTANKAIEINQNGHESLYTAGYAAYYLKNYQEAVKILNKAVILKPDSVNALFILGLSLRQTGEYIQAEKSLLKAKKQAKNLVPEINWQLALLYTNNLKKYKEAIEELEAFLKAKPDYDEAEKVKELIKKLKAKSNS
jgi:tetratricopeptide (TPR) repeat protein